MAFMTFIALFIINSLVHVNGDGNEYFTAWDNEATCFGKSSMKIPPTMNDKYADLQAIVDGRITKNTPAKHGEIIVTEKLSKDNPTMAELLNFQLRWHSSNLEVFQYSISKNEMYKENNKFIPALLNDMATMPLEWIEEKENGTQFKLIIWMPKETQTFFKPMRMEREEMVHPNHFYFDELERHNAEIAGFHLDKILGFRRAIPTVGRAVHIMKEIYPLVDDNLLNTFYESPYGNTCFHGHCEVYCDTNHPICGKPKIIEGSFAAHLPTHENATRMIYRHPWRRSYDKRRTAPWETDQTYCEKIRYFHPYNSGRRLLDIMDMAVFDFLTGNMDRHHYEMFQIFGDDSFTIHLDQGRAFGRPYIDEVSILAPLTQCCIIRKSTLNTLLRFHNGSKKLSQALREAMSSDPLTPLLWEPHLEALDRRNVIILEAVRTCLRESNEKNNEI